MSVPPLGFEELPSRAKKKRRLTAGQPVSTIPPSINVGVGISLLDTSRLAGSQRLGIIGLPNGSA